MRQRTCKHEHTMKQSPYPLKGTTYRTLDAGEADIAPERLDKFSGAFGPVSEADVVRADGPCDVHLHELSATDVLEHEHPDGWETHSHG